MARKLNSHEAQALFGTTPFAELFPSPVDCLDHQLRLAAAHPMLDDPASNLKNGDFSLFDEFAPDKWFF